MVNTEVCGTFDLGSIPSSHPALNFLETVKQRQIIFCSNQGT